MTRKTENWQEALELLKRGNESFYTGSTKHPERGRETLFAQYAQQFPFAAILSCADSRVVPELLFDVGIGDLFTCRIAGTALSDSVIGSLEFAVDGLGVPLLVVMGHENCGAFRACIEKEGFANVRGISWQLTPIIEECKNQGIVEPVELLRESIILNAKRVARQLRSLGPTLGPRVNSGKLKIIPAYHSLFTGKVVFFDPVD